MFLIKRYATIRFKDPTKKIITSGQFFSYNIYCVINVFNATIGTLYIIVSVQDETCTEIPGYTICRSPKSGKGIDLMSLIFHESNTTILILEYNKKKIYTGVTSKRCTSLSFPRFATSFKQWYDVKNPY